MNQESKKTVFGVDLEKLKKHCSGTQHSCDSNSPINENEYLEPCIRGGNKILNDPQQKEMMKKIYRGI